MMKLTVRQTLLIQHQQLTWYLLASDIIVEVSILVDNIRIAQCCEVAHHVTLAPVGVVDDQLLRCLAQLSTQNIQHILQICIGNRRCLEMIIVIDFKIPLSIFSLVFDWLPSTTSTVMEFFLFCTRRPILSTTCNGIKGSLMRHYTIAKQIKTN